MTIIRHLRVRAHPPMIKYFIMSYIKTPYKYTDQSNRLVCIFVKSRKHVIQSCDIT